MKLSFDHLTGVELDRAHDAAHYLYEHKDLLGLDPILRTKLETLRSDLRTEQEDRRKIAHNVTPISRDDFGGRS